MKTAPANVCFLALFGFVLIGNADSGETRRANGGVGGGVGGVKEKQVFAQKAPYLGFFRSDPSVLWQDEGAGDEKQPRPGARWASGILMIRGSR